MGQLALFQRDKAAASFSDSIGTGTATRFHYRAPRGFGKKRREARLLSSLAAGMHGIQPEFCTLSGIPCLSGNAARLVIQNLPTLLPRRAERIALYAADGLSVETLTALVRRVQFLELIDSGGLEEMTESVFNETGICIPLRLSPSPGFLPVRLPGAEKGAGLDLTDPEKSCRFLPPPPLRSIWHLTPKTGGTLDALLTFFELSPCSGGVFLSNFTK